MFSCLEGLPKLPAQFCAGRMFYFKCPTSLVNQQQHPILLINENKSLRQQEMCTCWPFKFEWLGFL